MVKCRHCAFYNGTTCTDPLGVYFNKKIENPDEDVECNAYVDIVNMYLVEDILDI